MKKQIAILLLLFVGLTSFTAHKFYVAIYQINYASDKKMLQITTRVFADDLNDALEKRYQRKFHLGEKEQTDEDVSQMQNYFSNNFRIKINGDVKPMQYLSLENENNVLICYFRMTGVASVKTLEVRNKILFDFVTDQQNIIQTNVGGVKKNMLLTVDNPTDTVNF